MKGWKKAIVPALLAGICLFAGGTALAAEKQADGEDTIADGVFIGGIDVGGMSAEEAQASVEALMNRLEESQVLISFNGEEDGISLREMDFRWNNPEVVKQAAVLGTTGNVLERYKSARVLENETVSFDLDYTWDESKLLDYLQSEAQKRQTEAVEATIKREKKQFIITESVTGVTVDVASTMKRITEQLNKEWQGGDIRVEAVAEVVEPKFTTEMAESIQDILGEHTTNYNPAQTDRSTNLRVGTGYIDGVLLLPGESLSFFDYLYPCTAARGYKGATAYQGGRYVESLGGGICQVSTTCYNAVLKAELEVVSRSPHTMTVNYADPGLDSGQAWSSGRNLEFSNNTDYPVYVEAYASGGTVYIGLWGKETRPSNRKVQYYSKYSEEHPYAGVEEITYDPNLPYGYRETTQHEYPKVVAMAYKRVIIDGKVVSDEPMYKEYDYYRATPNYVTEGTGGLSVEEYLAGQQPAEEQPQPQPQPQPPAPQPTTPAPTEPTTPETPSVETPATPEAPSTEVPTTPAPAEPVPEETTSPAEQPDSTTGAPAEPPTPADTQPDTTQAPDPATPADPSPTSGP